MLRCSPSRITLTASDISDFEQRFAARQHARLEEMQIPNIRLSPGPGRQIDVAQNKAPTKIIGCASSSPTNDCPNEVETIQIGFVCNAQPESLVQDAVQRNAPSVSPVIEPEPRPFSSTRARRRHARSNEQRSYPESTLPPALNIEAPVFVPRIRIGAAIESSIGSDAGHASHDLHWNSLDSSHSSNNLRIRPSSEQNADPAHRRQINDERSRAAQHPQTDTALHQGPNLERYPILRLPIRNADRRGSDGSHAHVVDLPRAGRQVSESPLTAVVSSSPPTQHDGQPVHYPTDLAVRSPLDGAVDESGAHLPLTIKSIEAQSRVPSQQQPAVHVGQRVSSLACNRGFDPSRDTIDTNSSIVTRSYAAAGLDAATEFLRMRNSPLDDLTERLSRLSGRPRSVESPWERQRHGEGRIRLLSGDPFRHDSTRTPTPDPIRLSSELNGQRSGLPSSSRPNGHSTLHSGPATDPTVTEGSVIITRTPPVQSGNSSSPRKPLADKSPAKIRASPGSASRSRPVPSASTPMVKIYDDTAPAYMQPQTPADIPRTSRRPRGGARTATNTFERSGDGITIASPVPSSPPVTVARATRQRGSQESENDAESQLPGLEQDRQVWLSRHGGGSLDTTPPVEGRYERFLS